MAKPNAIAVPDPRSPNVGAHGSNSFSNVEICAARGARLVRGSRTEQGSEEAKADSTKRKAEPVRLRVVVLKFSAPIDLRQKLPRSAGAPQRDTLQIAAGQWDALLGAVALPSGGRHNLPYKESMPENGQNLNCSRFLRLGERG